MKHKLKRLILPFLFFVIVSGCAASESADVMSEIDEAIEQNQTLENATFTRKMEATQEGWEQEAEGVFISLDNNAYNWVQTEYIGGDENNFHQILELDGQQQELHSIGEENVDANWQPVEGQTYELSQQIQPLFENNVQDEYIEEVETTEENGKTIVLHLSDAYTENFKNEAVKDLEDTIATLEDAGDDTGYIEALEMQIQMINEREYSDPENEMVINDEGYLVQFLERYTFTNPEAEPVTITITYEITDYNLENASELFPAL